MLIYEKIGSDEKRHLYGAESNIPAAADPQLTYEADGETIAEPTRTDDMRDNGHGGIMRKSDGKTITAFVGEQQVIPQE